MASLCESVGVQSSDNNEDDSDGLIVDVDGEDGAVDDAHHSQIMRDTINSTASGAASTGAAAAAGAGAAGEPHPSSCNTLARDTGTTAARETEEAAAGAVGAAVTAVGPADPDRDWQYSADKLRAQLMSISAENKTVQTMAAAVKEACLEHGVKLATCASRRGQVAGGGSRLVMCAFKCVHGMPNRQGGWKGKIADNNLRERKCSSQRTGCDFKISVRWPLRSEEHPYPRLTSMELNHKHGVDKLCVEIDKMKKAPMTPAMKAAVAQLTATQAVVLEALHHQKVNTQAVQNASSQGGGGAERLYDVQNLLEKVQACTEGGGVYKVKLDAKGCFSHVFWMTAEQIALATRYGAVLLYDDTAAKNRYHLPLGLGVLIDGEYNTRIVFQTVWAEARTDAFEWVLETFKQARGGAAPDVFIQDADEATTRASQRVFPHAKRRRCLWYLGQDVANNLKPLLGGQFDGFLDQFYRTRGRLTLAGFETEYTKLVETYPTSKGYMDTLYNDREQWAEYCSVLTFGIASFTTNRIESMHAVVRQFCSAKTSLANVFGFFARTVENQSDRAAFRDAQLHMTPAEAPQVERYWFGDAVVEPLKYALGVWPFKFTQEEMVAAAVFCSSPESAVLDGPDRAAALSEFDYIGDMAINVETVALIVENRDGTDLRFVVLGMDNGSHLCSCRTLQTLGLCCRHFWRAMRLSRRYKFHVGVLSQHWLTQKGRKPTSDWPEAVAPKWAAALNHRVARAEDFVLEAPTVSAGGQGSQRGANADGATVDPPPGRQSSDGGRWPAVPGGATSGPSPRQTREDGATGTSTPQDRQFLYVDLLKRTTAAVSEGIEAVHPDTLRQLVASFELQVRTASRIESGGAGASVGAPGASVRLPASSSNGKRPRWS